MTTVTQRIPAEPSSPLWGEPAWPDHFTHFRPHQTLAIESILAYFEDGADVVLLNAPTGAGKTVIAEAVRRLLRPKRTLYCPDTKSLQDQVMADFGAYARLLKGRSNYPTADHPEAFNDRWNPISAADCTKKMVQMPACGDCTLTTDKPVLHCQFCHPLPKQACPYELAKAAALKSPLAVLNTSYFIAEANGPASFGWSKDTGTPDQLVIIDEADTLEAALMNQVEVYISKKRREQYGIEMPERKTVESAWLKWCNEEGIPKVRKALDTVTMRINLGVHDSDVLKEARYLTNLYDKLSMLRFALIAGNAVYDGYDEGNIIFQPVHVGSFGQSMIWRHAQKFLLMSATIIDPYQTAEEIGIINAGLRWEVVNVDSTFPPERRPIHIVNAANMVWKEKATAWPEMALAVKKVLMDRHAGDRVLVHTVSYEFTRYLADKLAGLGRPVLIYESARERESTLENYKRLDGAVLLAPSMDRGIDLPGDLCRAVIVCKMPFPNTKDKRTAARMYGNGGSRWFQVQTIRKLVQMTGRGMRGEDDFCDTWILDAQFCNNIWKSGKDLLPGWWKAALDWSGGGLML